MPIKFDKVLTNVVEDVKKTNPMLFLQKKDKNTYIINDYIIKKNGDFYDISKNSKIIMENVVMLEAAIALVEALIKNVGTFHRISEYEKEYSKYLSDYKFAEHVIKNKTSNKEVLEDKMFFCKQKMAQIKHKIESARTV